MGESVNRQALSTLPAPHRRLASKVRRSEETKLRCASAAAGMPLTRVRLAHWAQAGLMPFFDSSIHLIFAVNRGYVSACQ